MPVCLYEITAQLLLSVCQSVCLSVCQPVNDAPSRATWLACRRLKACESVPLAQSLQLSGQMRFARIRGREIEKPEGREAARINVIQCQSGYFVAPSYG